LEAVTLKKVFIRDLKEREQVETSFLVTRKDSGVSKSGKPYLNLRLRDRTGEVDARVWDNAEEISKNFEKDDVVRVKGQVVAYQGELQINVLDIRGLAGGEYSLRDYLPSSERDPEEMMNELGGVIRSIGDRHLRALLEVFFEDPDISKRFKLAPAAKVMHHPYLGGLLEHVLSMCGLVKRVEGHYEDINWDLVTTGAILHDIGKIYELSYERSFDYTVEGRLLGHITIEMGLIEEKIRKVPGFPEKLALLLKHDAKLTAMQELIKSDTGPDPDWTPFNKLFERFIFKGGRYESVEGEKKGKKEKKEEPELF
jgi:3'-5' exoribonuclease